MSNDPSAPGPIDHLVQVSCDPARHLVTLACPRITIRPRDRVIWSFSGIPEGWSPWLQVRRENEGDSFLGPFASLSQSSGGVWGACQSGQAPGLFSYRVLIQKGAGLGWGAEASVLFSRAGEIEVVAESTGTNHAFDVTVSGTGAEARLSVTPPMVSIAPGDTLEWRFSGIPGNPGSWRPRVDFVQYSGTGEVPNLLLGPFNSLTYTADSAKGMGNNGVTGVYHFEVTLLSAGSGEVLWFSSGDPAVDNRGTVGDPGSGF